MRVAEMLNPTILAQIVDKFFTKFSLFSSKMAPKCNI